MPVIIAETTISLHSRASRETVGNGRVYVRFELPSTETYTLLRFSFYTHITRYTTVQDHFFKHFSHILLSNQFFIGNLVDFYVRRLQTNVLVLI